MSHRIKKIFILPKKQIVLAHLFTAVNIVIASKPFLILKEKTVTGLSCNIFILYL